MCSCQHNTAGLSCERCKDGYYGDSTAGTSTDCKPCPCPGGATCAVVPKTKEVVCTNCPTGTTGESLLLPLHTSSWFTGTILCLFAKIQALGIKNEHW